MRLSSPTSPTLLALAATAASALNLFVADYSGSITTLSLSESNSSYTLDKTFETTACGPSPAWLTLDVNRGLLFCVNEGITTPNGSLSSFTINANGSLHLISNLTTLGGPVSSALYGNPAAAEHGIVLAHYGGSAVSTFTVSAGGNLTLNEEFVFEDMPSPGPDPERQDKPHPHQALLDPTGQYILVPDLGADLVRIFGWDVADLKLKELEPLVADPGSGPRHIAFWTPQNIPGGTTYMYLVEELSSRVAGYAVQYSTDYSGLSFNPIGSQSTLGYHNLVRRNAPAEIQISPDNKFLLVSNRNSTAFTLPNPEIGPSDSLSTFQLCPNTGSLSARHHQLSPSGGLYPRHFATNSAGNLVAAALQLSGSVVILERDTATGLMMLEPVARIAIPANVTTVMWDEVARSGVTGLTGMGVGLGF